MRFTLPASIALVLSFMDGGWGRGFILTIRRAIGHAQSISFGHEPL